MKQKLSLNIALWEHTWLRVHSHGVNDSSLKSPNNKLIIKNLNLFTMKILC